VGVRFLMVLLQGKILHNLWMLAMKVYLMKFPCFLHGTSFEAKNGTWYSPIFLQVKYSIPCCWHSNMEEYDQLCCKSWNKLYMKIQK
jgi:hypothetical protein